MFGCANVYIHAVNVSVSPRECAHIFYVCVHVDLCPPAHVYRFTGTLTVETSCNPAPHSCPTSCSEWVRLAPASTPHAVATRVHNMQMRAFCPPPLPTAHKGCAGNLEPPFLLLLPRNLASLQVLFVPTLRLSICPFPSLSPLRTAIASCPS